MLEGSVAYALALPLDQQAVAIHFDLMKPIRTGWNFGAARRDARLILAMRTRQSNPAEMRVSVAAGFLQFLATKIA